MQDRAAQAAARDIFSAAAGQACKLCGGDAYQFSEIFSCSLVSLMLCCNLLSEARTSSRAIYSVALPALGGASYEKRVHEFMTGHMTVGAT